MVLFITTTSPSRVRFVGATFFSSIIIIVSSTTKSINPFSFSSLCKNNLAQKPHADKKREQVAEVPPIFRL
jgi:hypothetical protein|tara:strand:- start:1163 stop:1375 length:213 start_codon:yes stop_codon:yes gene_type:complete